MCVCVCVWERETWSHNCGLFANTYELRHCQVKSRHLYLYSAFNNTNCVKATAQYQNRFFFELNAFYYWIQWCHCPAQFSLNSICAIKSAILCPQLSKPETTTARNQNSIGDRTEKKKPGSVRGAVPLWPDEPVFCSNCSKGSVSSPLVPVVFSRWLSRWRGLHWGSLSGAHLGVLVSTDIQSCRDRL